MEMIFKRTLKP